MTMQHPSLRAFMAAVATGLIAPLLAACGSEPPASTQPAGATQATPAGVPQGLFRSAESASRESSGRAGSEAGSQHRKQQPSNTSRVNRVNQPSRQNSTSGPGSTGAAEVPTLLGIEVEAGDSTFDRVVFHFAGVGDNLPEYDVEYLGGYPHAPGSGKPVEMEGQHFLGVSFTHAVTDGSVPKVLDEDLPTVAEVRYLGGFERVQEAAIGVSSCHGSPQRPSFEVRPSAGDIIVDVRAPDCGADEPVTRECGDVAFEENTDSGAFGITATGVGCATARDVAALVEGRVGESYSTPSGFSCRAEYDGSQPTPNYVYTCTRDGARVEFVTG